MPAGRVAACVALAKRERLLTAIAPAPARKSRRPRIMGPPEKRNSADCTQKSHQKTAVRARPRRAGNVAGITLGRCVPDLSWCSSPFLGWPARPPAAPTPWSIPSPSSRATRRLATWAWPSSPTGSRSAPSSPGPRRGSGAVATQSFVDPAYGLKGLGLMRGGTSAPDALKQLVKEDPQPDGRQVAMIDTQGRVDAYTGKSAVAAAGHIVGEQFSAQANMMANDKVWPAMAEAYRRDEGRPRRPPARRAGRRAGRGR